MRMAEKQNFSVYNGGDTGLWLQRFMHAAQDQYKPFPQDRIPPLAPESRQIVESWEQLKFREGLAHCNQVFSHCLNAPYGIAKTFVARKRGLEAQLDQIRKEARSLDDMSKEDADALAVVLCEIYKHVDNYFRHVLIYFWMYRWVEYSKKTAENPRLSIFDAAAAHMERYAAAGPGGCGAVFLLMTLGASTALSLFAAFILSSR